MNSESVVAPDDRCIFCRRPVGDTGTIEHIIPDSLGCPEGFVLCHDEVCGNCQIRLSRADSKLIEVFALFRPYLGHKTKKGKWPRADLGNLQITRTDTNVDVRLDGDVPGDSVLQSIERHGNEGRVRFKTAVRLDGRLSRGVHKIALEAVAFTYGREFALNPAFDVVRDYALGVSGGFRPVLIVTDGEPVELAQIPHGGVSVWLPEATANIRFPSVSAVLCGVPFIASLAPDSRELLRLGREMNAKAGITIVVRCDERGIVRDL